MATQTLALPAAVSDYRSRLVDPRKLAYVDACIEATNQGQPWPMADKMPSELAEQVRTKLRRYGLKDSTSKPATIAHKAIEANRSRAEARTAANTAIRERAYDLINDEPSNCPCGAMGEYQMSVGEWRCGPCSAARRVTNDNPATSPVIEAVEAMLADSDPIVVCAECKQACRQSEIHDGICGAPHCWKGFRLYSYAHSAWTDARDSYVGAYVKAYADSGMQFNRSAVQSAWIGRNREPMRDDFEGKGNISVARDYETFIDKPHCRSCATFRDGCGRCVKAKESFYARQPRLEGTTAHGRHSLVTNNPRIDKIQVEIQNADKLGKSERQWWMAKGYLGRTNDNARGWNASDYSRANAWGLRPSGLITETIAGEPWGKAADRMTKDSAGIDWQTGESVPCSAREFSTLTIR